LTLSLWLSVKAIARLFAAGVLGYRRDFELSFDQNSLRLSMTKKLLGKEVSTQTNLLPLTHLNQARLRESGEDPSFTVGLMALGLGTFLGVQFISEGLLAAKVSTWLLGSGGLFLALGLAVDFFLGSGRTPKTPNGRAELTLGFAGAQSWVLSLSEAGQAEPWMNHLSERLSQQAPADAPGQQQAPQSEPPPLAR
jgi:hypothetical protein